MEKWQRGWCVSGDCPKPSNYFHRTIDALGRGGSSLIPGAIGALQPLNPLQGCFDDTLSLQRFSPRSKKKQVAEVTASAPGQGPVERTKEILYRTLCQVEIARGRGEVNVGECKRTKRLARLSPLSRLERK
jgi:hypothetical protein